MESCNKIFNIEKVKHKVLKQIWTTLPAKDRFDLDIEQLLHSKSDTTESLFQNYFQPMVRLTDIATILPDTHHPITYKRTDTERNMEGVNLVTTQKEIPYTRSVKNYQNCFLEHLEKYKKPDHFSGTSEQDLKTKPNDPSINEPIIDVKNKYPIRSHLRHFQDSQFYKNKSSRLLAANTFLETPIETRSADQEEVDNTEVNQAESKPHLHCTSSGGDAVEEGVDDNFNSDRTSPVDIASGDDCETIGISEPNQDKIVMFHIYNNPSTTTTESGLGTNVEHSLQVSPNNSSPSTDKVGDAPPTSGTKQTQFDTGNRSEKLDSPSAKGSYLREGSNNPKIPVLKKYGFNKTGEATAKVNTFTTNQSQKDKSKRKADNEKLNLKLLNSQRPLKKRKMNTEIQAEQSETGILSASMSEQTKAHQDKTDPYEFSSPERLVNDFANHNWFLKKHGLAPDTTQSKATTTCLKQSNKKKREKWRIQNKKRTQFSESEGAVKKPTKILLKKRKKLGRNGADNIKSKTSGTTKACEYPSIPSLLPVTVIQAKPIEKPQKHSPQQEHSPQPENMIATLLNDQTGQIPGQQLSLKPTASIVPMSVTNQQPSTAIEPNSSILTTASPANDTESEASINNSNASPLQSNIETLTVENPITSNSSGQSYSQLDITTANVNLATNEKQIKETSEKQREMESFADHTKDINSQLDFPVPNTEVIDHMDLDQLQSSFNKLTNFYNRLVTLEQQKHNELHRIKERKTEMRDKLADIRVKYEKRHFHEYQLSKETLQHQYSPVNENTKMLSKKDESKLTGFIESSNLLVQKPCHTNEENEEKKTVSILPTQTKDITKTNDVAKGIVGFDNTKQKETNVFVVEDLPEKTSCETSGIQSKKREDNTVQESMVQTSLKNAIDLTINDEPNSGTKKRRKPRRYGQVHNHLRARMLRYGEPHDNAYTTTNYRERTPTFLPQNPNGFHNRFPFRNYLPPQQKPQNGDTSSVSHTTIPMHETKLSPAATAQQILERVTIQTGPNHRYPLPIQNKYHVNTVPHEASYPSRRSVTQNPLYVYETQPRKPAEVERNAQCNVGINNLNVPPQHDAVYVEKIIPNQERIYNDRQVVFAEQMDAKRIYYTNNDSNNVQTSKHFAYSHPGSNYALYSNPNDLEMQNTRQQPQRSPQFHGPVDKSPNSTFSYHSGSTEPLVQQQREKCTAQSLNFNQMQQRVVCNDVGSRNDARYHQGEYKQNVAPNSYEQYRSSNNLNFHPKNIPESNSNLRTEMKAMSPPVYNLPHHPPPPYPFKSVTIDRIHTSTSSRPYITDTDNDLNANVQISQKPTVQHTFQQQHNPSVPTAPNAPNMHTIRKEVSILPKPAPEQYNLHSARRHETMSISQPYHNPKNSTVYRVPEQAPSVSVIRAPTVQLEHTNFNNVNNMQPLDYNAIERVQSSGLAATDNMAHSLDIDRERSENIQTLQQENGQSLPSSFSLKCANCENEANFICSGCKKTTYCSIKCQNESWKTHVEHCKD